MTAYYNEIDSFAAQWLRELIKANLIAPGEVDERSIEDVVPKDLMGYTQCHFFAGIGVWSHALRQAGWPNDRPVWTGSCPCQPFSAAGKGGGLADERNLWPAFEWLIRQCRPDTIFGEQVESAIKHDWLDHVALSLEDCGYTVGAVGFPACSVGAPHIRQRLYWVAESQSERSRRTVRELQREGEGDTKNGKRFRYESNLSVPTRLMADAENPNRRPGECRTEAGTWTDGEWRRGSSGGCNAGIVGDSGEQGLQRYKSEFSQRGNRELSSKPSATNGFWSNADWIPCRDGKARPIEPGTFPLAHGAAARVGRLRGYGNAIVAPQAEAFIRAFMDIAPPL